MLLNLKKGLALSSLVAFNALAHPDPYSQQFTGLVDCHKYPTIMSYHVHITYMETNTDQIKQAGALRQEALEEFAPLLGSDTICHNGLFDDGKLCMIMDEHEDLAHTSGGPFPIGQWSMFVPVHYYNRVVPWFNQHRGEFSLLVHPNSGCEYEDHSDWAQWTGDKWNLDLSIFTPYVQSKSSFNQTLGTPENPSCLTAGGVCAAGDHTSLGFAPQIVCCEGMSCNCGAGADVCYCK